ncbi:MAG: hypothetical protein C5B43_03685 [Verrucomicrobia bacterium]|nr:MAG: hypothetical protein C5B43_03685 [Verrucomicrobiota bacterium]
MGEKFKISSSQRFVRKQGAEEKKIATGKGAMPRAKKFEKDQPARRKEEVKSQKLTGRSAIVQEHIVPRNLETALVKVFEELKIVYPNIFKVADINQVLKQVNNLPNEKIEKFIKAVEDHLEEKKALQKGITPAEKLAQQPKIPENLSEILASTLAGLTLEYDNIEGINQLNEEIVGLPVEFVEIFISAAVSQLALRYTLTNILNELKEEYPKLFFGDDINPVFEKLLDLPIERIENFIKLAHKHLEEKKVQQHPLTKAEKLAKRQEVPKELRITLGKVLSDLAGVYPNVGDIHQINEQIVGLPVEFIECYIQVAENKIPLMQDLKKALIELSTVQPDLFFNGDIMPIFNQLVDLPNERIENFVKAVAQRVEEKKQPSKGWEEWFKGIATSIFDRTVKRLYQTGEENVEWMKASLGEYASIFLSKGKDTISNLGGTRMLNVANASVRCVGNFALATATLTIPFITEWSYRIAMVATGTQELGPSAAEEVKKEAKAIREAVDQYLNAAHISERPINDLTYTITTTFYTWAKVDLIKKVLKASLPNASMRVLFSLIALQGEEIQKIWPEFILTLALTAFLTDILGPQAIPGAKMPGYPADWPTIIPGKVGATNISILASGIVTMILSGSLPLKKSLVKFLLKGPTSLKNIGLVSLVKKFEKKVLGFIGINPLVTYTFAYFLSTVTDKLIQKPAKTGIKKAIEYGYDVTEEKIKSDVVVTKEKESGQSTK